MGAFDEYLKRAPNEKSSDPRDFTRIRWEHQVVRSILKHFALEGYGGEVAASTRDRIGKSRLTFGSFRDVFPSFPANLACRRIGYVGQTSAGELLRDFKKTRIYRAFCEEEEGYSETEQWRFGLVFEWLKVWPTAIVHTGRLSAPSPGETCLLYPIANSEQVVTVQSFKSFLSGLRWQPERAGE